MHMKALFISLFLFSFSIISVHLNPERTYDDQKLRDIITELDLTLDNFFALQQEEDLDLFIAGVRHAARARLLLEQLLGDQIENLNVQTDSETTARKELQLIALRVQDLSGALGKELWRQDFEDKQAALLRLSELENLVKGLKKRVETDK